MVGSGAPSKIHWCPMNLPHERKWFAAHQGREFSGSPEKNNLVEMKNQSNRRRYVDIYYIMICIYTVLPEGCAIWWENYVDCVDASQTVVLNMKQYVMQVELHMLTLAKWSLVQNTFCYEIFMLLQFLIYTPKYRNTNYHFSNRSSRVFIAWVLSSPQKKTAPSNYVIQYLPVIIQEVTI